MSNNRDASPVRQQQQRQPSPEIDRTSRVLDKHHTDHLPGPRSKEEIRKKLEACYQVMRASIERNYGARHLEPVCWGRLGRTFNQCIERIATEMWVECDFYLYEKLIKPESEWVALVLPILYIDSDAVGYQFFIHCCDEFLERICRITSLKKMIFLERNIELALSRKLGPDRVRSWLSAINYVRSAERGPTFDRLHYLNECVKRLVEHPISGPPSFMDYEWMRCKKVVKRNMTHWKCGATAYELAAVLYRYDATLPIKDPRDIFPLVLLCAIDAYSSGKDNESDVEINVNKMLHNLRTIHTTLGMFNLEEICAARLWCNRYSHDFYFHSDFDQLLLNFLEGKPFDLNGTMDQHRHPIMRRIPLPLFASSSSSSSSEESESASSESSDSAPSAAKPDGESVAPVVADA